MLNRLEEAVNADGICAKYVYNGLGHRIGENRSGDMLNPELTVNFTLDMTRQYNNLLQKEEVGIKQSFIWDDNVVAAKSSYSDEFNYYLQDEMGSPIRLINEIGQVKETYAYDEFGKDVIKNFSILNPFGFTGYQRNKIANTYYAQAREYLPSMGRFAARDFVKGRQDDLITMNEYIYCKDDPNNYEDLNGMFVLTTLAIIGAGALIGAATSAAVNGVTQLVKMKQGKQESFQWGSLVGSAVNGAIVGGVTAIPGVGLFGAVASGFVGSAAESTISQWMDDGSVNGWKVLENAAVGAVTAGIFFKVGKALEGIKSNLFPKKPDKSLKFTTSSKKIDTSFDAKYTKVSKNIKGIENKMEAIKEAGKKASGLTKQQLAHAITERNGLLKKFIIDKVKSEGKGFTKSVIFTTFSITKADDLTKDILSKLSPIYKDEETLSKYLEDYFGTQYGKFTGKCPLYI